ncbi:LacI family DNA-binding transcriptional regulator [Weissella soli]|uniref:LacI family DNA-binding transcriptional regulator n=1 Tax=Weissella soli TaxID=155866 RepID=UPI00359FA265
MATLKDVAALAHVSKMTVSRALNHPELVSAEIRQDVLAAVTALNYQPNRAGLALSKHKSFVFQFLMLEDVDQVEPYYGKLLIYISDALQQSGYTLELGHSRQSLNPNVDGLIVVGARHHDLVWLKALDIPYVSYGEISEDIPYVDVDNRLGTKIATQQLLMHGYTNIHYIGLTMDEYFARQREQGYLNATQAAHNLPHVHRITNNDRLAETLVQQLALTPNMAFVCATDQIGLGVVRGILDAGFRIPEDVAVIGFDGVYLDQIASRRLTTIRQPLPQIANELIHLLEAQLTNRAWQPQLIVPELIVRESTRN